MRENLIGGLCLAFALACAGLVPNEPAPVSAEPEVPEAPKPVKPVRPPPPHSVPPIAGGCEPKQPRPSIKGGVFSVSICPNLAAIGPLYVGATLQQIDGHRRDLPYVMVPLDQRGEPVTIKEALPAGYERWVTVVWAEELDCNNGTDPDDGCTRFKKALNEPVWSWPEWNGYDDLSFDEIVPVRVQLLDSGGGATAMAEARAQLKTKYSLVDGGTAQKQRDYIEILYKRDRFRPLADELRAALPKDRHYVMTLWSEAPEAVVIALGS